MDKSNKKAKMNLAFTKKNLRSYVMILALLAIWFVFAILTKGVYITPRNVSNLFRQMATTGIIAMGMTMCLITGYFDLSIGSVVGLTGAITAVATQQWGFPPFMSILFAVFAGASVGIWHGFWIAYKKLPAFIVTLGGQLIFRGGVLWLTKSNTIPLNNEVFITIGQGYVQKPLGYALAIVATLAIVLSDILNRKSRKKYGFRISSAAWAGIKYSATIILVGLFIVVMNIYSGIPNALIILIVIALIFSFVLSHTKFGKCIYAVGGNSKAARLSGIDNEKTVMGVFVILGITGAISGIILAGRLAASMPASGSGMELDAIAACVIGGVSLAGGKGNIYGALVGALVMASLANGMSLLTLPTFSQNIINGLVLILAVWVDTINNKKGN